MPLDILDPQPTPWTFTVYVGTLILSGCVSGIGWLASTLTPPAGMETEYVKFLLTVVYALSGVILGLVAGAVGMVKWMAPKLLRVISENSKTNREVQAELKELRADSNSFRKILEVQMEHWNEAGIAAINVGIQHITDRAINNGSNLADLPAELAIPAARRKPQPPSSAA